MRTRKERDSIMKKEMQKVINERIDILYDCSVDFAKHCDCCSVKQLRHCTATVETYYNDDVVICMLKSYNTYVAAVICAENRCTGIDVLRKVYGYSATSAQHIAKFFTDYMRFPCRVKNIPYEELRYYAV